MANDPIPPLRPLECTLLGAGEQRFLRLHDELEVSPDAEIPLPYVALLQLFDGTRSILDVQAEIVRTTGQIIPSAFLERIVGELDGAYLLASPRFEERYHQVLKEWEESPVRAAAHCGPGLCYPDDADALEREMEAFYGRQGAADASRPVSARPLRAVLAPHIDFGRGGHIYTWAYREVRERTAGHRADGGTAGNGAAGGAEAGPVFVVLGTCHKAMKGHFAVTAKSYATPWGPVPADVRFIERLEALAGGNLREDEYRHKREHTIEFQVVFLRHAMGDRPFSIVPVLVGGFHEAILQGVEPENEPAVGRFLDALAGALREAREAGRDAILVGGVDLAHVGTHFGDGKKLTAAFLDEVRERDWALLAAAAAVDSRRFFAEISRDNDRLRICGFGSIYSILAVLERAGPAGKYAGEVLAYDQAVNQEHDLCVSFASVAIEERH
jgi:MEMO1 family protein